MKRHGTSILEVLFAILIVSIGLLGSLAVMVVAGGTATKARVTDDASFLARRATHEFDTRGMRQPATWRQWNGTAFVPITRQPLVSYCIDSRFCVDNTANWAAASEFPYQHTDNPPGARMQRVAFLGEQPGPNLAAQQLFASHVFHVADDLAYDRPESDRSLPANQLWVEDGGTALARSSQGMYSWMATLVPDVDAYAALNQPTDPAALAEWRRAMLARLCTLSVVVFHQRPAGMTIDDFAERAVACNVLDGTSGGAIHLTSPVQERLKVNRGDWILLSGFQQLAARDTNGAVLNVIQIPRFNWYRVTDAERPEQSGGGWEVFASVVGRDWQFIHEPNPANQSLSGVHSNLLNQQAVIVPGAVTVHEKSVTILQ